MRGDDGWAILNTCSIQRECFFRNHPTQHLLYPHFLFLFDLLILFPLLKNSLPSFSIENIAHPSFLFLCFKKNHSTCLQIKRPLVHHCCDAGLNN